MTAPRRIRAWHEANTFERLGIVEQARHNAVNDNEADELGLVDAIVYGMGAWTLILGMVAWLGMAS